MRLNTMYGQLLNPDRAAEEHALGALMRMTCDKVGAMQSVVTGVAMVSG